MLKIKDLSKKYDQQIILDNINIEFKEKGFYVLLGESGAGKSTLLKMISLFEEPTHGEIIYQGKNILENKSNVIGEKRNTMFSYIFQEFNLIEYLTVKENLMLVEHRDVNQIKEVLETFGLGEYLEQEVSKLSGGERQRVTIARAILRDTPILIADEPTGNLDQKNSEEVIKILEEVSKTKLVIMVTHNESLLDQHVDYIYRIDNHKLILEQDQHKIYEQEVDVKQHSDRKDKLGKNVTYALIKKQFNKNRKYYIKSLILTTLISCFAFVFFLLYTNNVAQAYKESLETFDFQYVKSYEQDISSDLTTDAYEINVDITNDNNDFYQTKYSYIVFSEDTSQYDILYGNSIIDEFDIMISDYLASAILLSNGKELTQENYESLINLPLPVYIYNLVDYKISGIYNTNYECYMDSTTLFLSDMFQSVKDNYSQIVASTTSEEIIKAHSGNVELELQINDTYFYGMIIESNDQLPILYQTDSNEINYISLSFYARLMNQSVDVINQQISNHVFIFKDNLKLYIGDKKIDLLFNGIFDDSSLQNGYTTYFFMTDNSYRYDTKWIKLLNIEKTNTIDMTTYQNIAIDQSRLNSYFSFLEHAKVVFIIAYAILIFIYMIFISNLRNNFMTHIHREIDILRTIGYHKFKIYKWIIVHDFMRYVFVLIFTSITIILLSQFDHVNIENGFKIVFLNFKDSILIYNLIIIFIIEILTSIKGYRNLLN